MPGRPLPPAPAPLLQAPGASLAGLPLADVRGGLVLTVSLLKTSVKCDLRSAVMEKPACCAIREEGI